MLIWLSCLVTAYLGPDPHSWMGSYVLQITATRATWRARALNLRDRWNTRSRIQLGASLFKAKAAPPDIFNSRWLGKIYIRQNSLDDRFASSTGLIRWYSQALGNQTVGLKWFICSANAISEREVPVSLIISLNIYSVAALHWYFLSEVSQ